MAGTTARSANDVSSKVALLRAVVLAVTCAMTYQISITEVNKVFSRTDFTAILASLVLVIAQSTVKQC